MLSHQNKNVSGNTSGTDTESDLSDNEQRSTVRDIRRGAKKKELTMEVFLIIHYYFHVPISLKNNIDKR